MTRSNIFNIAWALSERLIQVVLSILVTGVIARYFGVELFGAYQLAMSVLFISTAMTWLCPAEIFYSKLREDGSLPISTVNTSIIYRLMISGLVYIGLLGYVLFAIDSHEQMAFVLILSASILYSEPLGIFRFQLECRGCYYLASRVRIFSLLSKMVLVMFFVVIQASPIWVVFAIVLEGVLVAVGCLFFYKKIDMGYKFSLRDVDIKLMRSFFKDGVKFWFGLVCMNAFLKFDRVFMEGKLSAEQFGNYAAAFSAFEQFTALATMLLAVMGPMYIYRTKPGHLMKNSMLMLALFGSLGVVGALILYLMAFFLITTLYGPAFVDAVLIFKKIIIVAPLVFMDVALASLIIKNKSALLFSMKWGVVLFLASFVNVFGYKLFGWQSGMLGYLVGWFVALMFSVSYAICQLNNKGYFYVATEKNH